MSGIQQEKAMAKRATLKDDGGKKPIAAEDLKTVIAEIGRQKELASEYAGNAGKATQTAVDRYGLEKNALTFARRLASMEEGKRLGVIRASIEYWQKLGFFDQIDAFDDVVEVLGEIVNRAHNTQPAKPRRSEADQATDDKLVH